MKPSIVPARALLDATLAETPDGFTPLWFRHELIGAVGPHWLRHLDPQLFELEPPASERVANAALPARIRVRAGDRRSEGGLVPAETLNRRFAEWAERLAALGLLPGWRGELIQLYGGNEAAPLLAIERSLLRPLGLLLRTVQVNVHSIADGQLRIWIARRSDRKPVDPGCYDTLVGGGMCDDETPLETLIRECAEEAGIDRSLARRAVPVGVLDSSAVVSDGGADAFDSTTMPCSSNTSKPSRTASNTPPSKASRARKRCAAIS